jgi:hypothetical protein
VPEFPADLQQVDWARHRHCRELGALPLRHVDLNDGRAIPYSIYQQSLPWDWAFTMRQDGTWYIRMPTVCQAAGLLGARHRLKGMDNGEIKAAAPAIFGGGSLKIISTLEGMPIPNLLDCLNEAIRFHHQDLVLRLLQKQKLEPDETSAQTAIAYANFEAFRMLIDPKHFQLPQTPLAFRAAACESIYHFIAKHNDVEAFKFLLSRLTGPFDPYAVGDMGQTFLHYACRFAGYDVVRFWCRNFNNKGLNAFDDLNMNPAHYVYICGINAKQQNRSPDDPTKPFSHFLRDLSRPTPTIAKP